MPAIWQPAFYKPQIGEIVDWDTWGMGRPKAEWWLNEGSGNLVNDASGNGNIGTLGGGTNWAAETHGTGVYCDGVSGEIRVYPPIAGNPQVTPWTQVMVVKYLSGVVLNRDNNQTILAYHLTANGGEYRVGESTTLFDYFVPSVIERFAVFSLVNKGNTAQLYIDSVPVSSAITPGSSPVILPITLMNNLQYNQYSAGYVASYHCWDSPLSASQVQALQGPVPIWSPRRYWWVTAGGAVSAAYYQSLLRANRQGRAA